MTKRALAHGLSLGFLVACMASAQTVGDVSSRAEYCDGCHSLNGISEFFSNVPTIAGLSAFSHSEALFIYRDGDRPCGPSMSQNMCEVAESLSEEEIELIAEYYAAKPFVAVPAETDPELSARGNQIHERECERCHTNGGSNPADDASILAGQAMDYMRQSFEHYLSGARYQTEKMKERMDKLSDEDIEALLHYYASQQ